MQEENLKLDLSDKTKYKDEILENINNLYEKYVEDDYMFCKFINYIKYQLPQYLENTKMIQIEKLQRKKNLEEISDEFIEQFLSKNKFYYNSNIEYFFSYNDEKYNIINEDDILHKVLTTISCNKDLIPWKYKIKNTIVKRIRERDLLKSIPESKTIQNVINLIYPSIFKNKEYAKYFLTIIGDIILKKNQNIFIITSKSKSFIKDLSQESCIYFGTSNMLHNFKFKYYDHQFNECRLLDMNEMVQSINVNVYPFKNNLIDLFCVATHYSKRYESSDKFLENNCKDEELIKHALYLKNNNEDEIIERFISTSTEQSSNCLISWKNMLYLWKIFIDEEKIPNVFFNNSLKQLLIKKLQFNEELDQFSNLTSKHLPLVSHFKQFWTEFIYTNEHEYELEIDELFTLFKKNNKNGLSNVNDQILLSLIRHFYPDTIIEEEKYLINVGCVIWDKKDEIRMALLEYEKDNIKQNVNIDQPLINAYEFYCNFAKKNNKLICSKRYFEKYFIGNYEEYIDENEFIDKKWWKK